MKLRTFLGTGLLIILISGAVMAQSVVTGGPPVNGGVLAGCASPPTARTGRAFYVDPVAGSAKGDGSQQRPWRTLEEVVKAGLIATTPTHWDADQRKTIAGNPNAPVKPGDTIYLLTGNHGSVILQGYYGKGLIGFNNPEFITIAALQGHMPVLTRLAIIGGNKWIARGLTVRSTNTGPKFMTSYNQVYNDYWLVTIAGPHNNIIIDDNHLESQSDVADWTIEDWATKRASGIQERDGTCVALTRNVFRNVGFGISTQSSDRVLIAANTIDRFSDDGIDYGSNNLVIDRNKITNSIEDGDGFHRDAMQGQPYAGTASLQNVTISNNIVIRQTDPKLPYPAYLQGIDTFDGTWSNMLIRGNTVVTNAWHGIAYYGVHGLNISDNIVLADAGRLLPCVNVRIPECKAKEVVVDTTSAPGINVRTSKQGTPSSAVTVKDNIVMGLGIDLKTGVQEFHGNVCIPADQKCTVSVPIGGRLSWYAMPGDYKGVTITVRHADHWFTHYDPANFHYDLRFTSDPRTLAED